MTDYEPYVADPVEPRRATKLVASAPWVLLIAVLVIAALFGLSRFAGTQQQDPSFEVPSEVAPTAPVP